MPTKITKSKKIENEFEQCGLTIMKREDLYELGDTILPGSASFKHFKTFFGVSPEVCGDTWVLLEKFFKVRGTPEQFLWAMMHLKVYASEDVTATLLGVNATTFRYYAWYYIKKISKLSVVLVSQKISNFIIHAFNIFICIVCCSCTFVFVCNFLF